MGLRCSLLGHAYGEPVTERDRERRGDEEVVTVRKLRTCRRCGAETVRSENTEVRHLGAVASDSASGAPADREAVGDAEEDRTSPSPDQSESDVAVSELVESAESEDPSPADSAASGPMAETDPESPGSSNASVDESETSTDAVSSAPESASAHAESSSQPPDSDDAIIIDDQTDPEPGTGGDPEPSPSEPGTGHTEEPAESRTGADSIDDIEAMADSKTAADAKTGGDTPPEAQSTDPPHSTADPESMFGTGPDDGPEAGGKEDSAAGGAADSAGGPDARGGRHAETDRDSESVANTSADLPGDPEPGSAAETDTGSDTWKEGHLPESKRSQQDTRKRDDPAYQFESHDATNGEQSGAGEPGHRGPSGIVSEGPIEVDSETETPYRSLACPECGFSESAGSSLRAGDICPECHRGYLAGRR